MKRKSQEIRDLARGCFKRDDLRGLWPEAFNCEVSRLVGQAMCERLRSIGNDPVRIVLGRDARGGSLDLQTAFARGIEAAGGSAVSIGLCSTEQVYYSCGRHLELYSGGAMITASHNPPTYNGVKMLHSGAVPFSPEDLSWIRERVLELLEPLEDVSTGDQFASHMLSLAGAEGFTVPADGVKVVVLCGHGVGGVAYAPIDHRLCQLGIESIVLEGEPDGSFPHGVPNPLLPTFNKRLGEAVLRHGADLGIGFDGDADRAGFVDQEGRVIEASHILALVAGRKLSTSVVSRPVVMRNLCSSQLLCHIFDQDSGVELIDAPVGHAQIKRLMRHDRFSDRVVFAGEHSGHYFHPDFYSSDSGILTALHMLGLVCELKSSGSSLFEALSDWRERYHWSGELNFDMPDRASLLAAMKTICGRYEGAMARDEIRIDPELSLLRCLRSVSGSEYEPGSMAAPDLKLVSEDGASGWWFVLRPSGNEPKLRLNVETWGDGVSLEKRTQKLVSELLELGAIPS